MFSFIYTLINVSSHRYKVLEVTPKSPKHISLLREQVKDNEVRVHAQSQNSVNINANFRKCRKSQHKVTLRILSHL